MTLPAQMTDRWARRTDPKAGERTLYWHVLMRGYPAVGDLAGLARQRLAPFAGLHMTPPEWLHMTTLVAGPADQFSGEELRQMTTTATEYLGDIAAITVSVGQVLYHPEAIMLAVTPAEALAPLRAAALAAMGTSTSGRRDTAACMPHVTLCYSTSEQPAQPILDALGIRLPERHFEISTLSLVIQDGPERAWDWTTVGTVHLGAGALA